MRSIPRFMAVMAATGALGLTLIACSDDGDGSGDVDAAQADAAAMIDAAPDPDAFAGPFRAGTIAVLDVTATNPGTGFSGATVNVSYTDITQPDVDPAFGDPVPPLGGCTVWIYNVGQDAQPPDANEGDITLTGAGLLSPIGTCSFDDATGAYECSTGNGTLGTGALAVQSGATTSITVLNNEFAGHDLIGSYLRVDGFTEAGNNGTFPVVDQTNDNIVVVANDNGTTETLAADGTFTVITGAGPTPANRDFLDSGVEDVVVDKNEGTYVPAFSSTLKASGEGLILGDSSTEPHALPISPAADATFSCDPGDNGNCGPNGGIITGFVLSGSTTDAPVAGLSPLAMPDPVTQWARFQCRGNPGLQSITLPQAALEAVLSSSPSRIETQLFRITADLSKPDTSIIVGHGFIGYTDTTP